jgi:hypothetical protein
MRKPRKMDRLQLRSSARNPPRGKGEILEGRSARCGGCQGDRCGAVQSRRIRAQPDHGAGVGVRPPCVLRSDSTDRRVPRRRGCGKRVQLLPTLKNCGDTSIAQVAMSGCADTWRWVMKQTPTEVRRWTYAVLGATTVCVIIFMAVCSIWRERST